MLLSNINWLAVLVSTIVAWGIGSLWYSALFGKAWQKEVGLSNDDLQGANMPLIFGSSFVMMFIMIFGLALSLNGHAGSAVSSPVQGALHGVFIGLLFAGTSMGINYLYQRKTIKLWLIDAFYQVLYLAIAGVILTLWK